MTMLNGIYASNEETVLIKHEVVTLPDEMIDPHYYKLEVIS